jgi:hypothetical protein
VPAFAGVLVVQIIVVARSARPGAARVRELESGSGGVTRSA